MEREWSLLEWVNTLQPEEQAFARQAWHYWQGTNGNTIPEHPPGMSQARAYLLLYHCKSLNNGQRGKRVMREKKTHSIRLTDEEFKELAYHAAMQDIDFSKYVRKCIYAGEPLVMAFPDKNFDHRVARP